MAPSRRSQRTEPPSANTRSSRRASQSASAGPSTTSTRARASTTAATAKSSATATAKPKPKASPRPAVASKTRRQLKSSKVRSAPESADDQSDSQTDDGDESGSDDDNDARVDPTDDDDARKHHTEELTALTHEVVDDEEETAGFVRRSTRRRISSDMPMVVMPPKAPVVTKKDKDKEPTKVGVPTATAGSGSSSSRGAVRRGSAASSSSSSDKKNDSLSTNPAPSARSTRRKPVSRTGADNVVVQVPTVKSPPIKRVYGKGETRRMSTSSQPGPGSEEEDAMDVDVDVVTAEDATGHRQKGITDNTESSFLRPALPCPSSEATITDRSPNSTPTPGSVPTGLGSAAAQGATEPASSATIRPKPKGIKRVGKRRRLEAAGGLPATGSVTSASSSDRDATATPPLLRSTSSTSSSVSHSPVIFGTPRNSVHGPAARFGQGAMNVSMDPGFPADPSGRTSGVAFAHQHQQRHPHLASPDSAMDLTSPVHNHRTSNPAQFGHPHTLDAWNSSGFHHGLPNQPSSPTAREFDGYSFGSQQPPFSPAPSFGAASVGGDVVDGRPHKRARTDSLSLVSRNSTSASQTVVEAAAALLMFSSATCANTSSEADVSPTTAASDLSGPPTNGPFSPPLDHHDTDMHHNGNPFASAWAPHSPTSTTFASPPHPPPPLSAAHSPETAYPTSLSQSFPSITTVWPSGNLPSMGPTPPPTATFDSSSAAPISPTFNPFVHLQMRRMSIESMTGGFNPGLAPPLYRRMSIDSTAATGGVSMGGYYTDDEDNMLISPVMRTVELRSPSPFTGMNGGNGGQQPGPNTNGSTTASTNDGQDAQSPTYAPFFTNGVPMDAARIAAVIDAVRRPNTMQPTLPAAGVQTWAQLFQRQPAAAAAPNASAAAALVSAQPPASMAAVLANLDVIPEEGVVPFTLEQLNAMAADSVGGLGAFGNVIPGIAPAAGGGPDGSRQPDSTLSAPNSAASTPTMSRQRPTILAQTAAPMIHHPPDLLREYAKQMADQYQLARTVADPVTTRAIMLHIVLANPQRPTTLPELINAFPHVDPLTVVHTCEMLADRPYAVARELVGPECSRIKDRLVKQAPVGQAQADPSKLQVVSLCKIAVIRGKGYRLDESYGLMVKRDGTGAAAAAGTTASASGSAPRRIPTGYTNSPGSSRGQLTIPTTLLSCTTKGRRRFLRYKDGHTFVHGYELPAVVVAHTRSATEATPGTVAPGSSVAAASAAAPPTPSTASAQSSEGQPAAASTAQANEPITVTVASATEPTAQPAATAPEGSTDQTAPSSETNPSTNATPAAAAAASAAPEAAAQAQPDRQQPSPADDVALGLPVAPSPGMFTPAVKERYLNAVTSARWTGRPADALKMLINLGPDARLSHRDVITRFGSEISLSTLTVALMYSWARPLLPVEEIPKEAKPDLWDAMVAHVPAGTDTSKMRLYLSIGLECEGLEQPWAECVVPTVNDRKYYLREWYVLVDGPQLVYADGTAPTVAEIPGGVAASSVGITAGTAAASGSTRVGATGTSRNKSSGGKKSSASAAGSKSSAGASGPKSAAASASGTSRPAAAAAASTTSAPSRPPSVPGAARAPGSIPSAITRPVPPPAPAPAAASAPAGAAAAGPVPRPIAPSTAGSRLLNAVASARLPAPSSSSRSY
ncbi:hypothetical protein BCR44DRAFT_63331 [Catenaria anguillulae PL171]|uniref:Uncharacterized protein n=1 Tax=Catenaria anguillulae PL171 TaxID=765915 RepID=A0A1Y2HRV2_9FUNG|nr:hypothetical protein BCR44DRAFT_63331 [Catenaria anguillulae PL171]